MSAEGIEFTGDLEFHQPTDRVIPTEDPGKIVEAKGVIHQDDLHIFLTEAILREVVDWSTTDVYHELGGVFVGELFSYKGRQWLDIQGYIKAQHYEHTAASFRFTHDSWSAITRVRETEYDDKKLVGWQHTHPGYGIFLSRADMFIQRHFFNRPWMVALVVDPKAGNIGFFQWKRGMQDVKPCGFFFVR